MKYHKQALTLVEVMVSIIIISFVFVTAFQVLSYVWVWKIRIIERSQIEKEAFFASERLIDLIKKWGSIDYEEYWNRLVLWNTVFSNWHFSAASAFWNMWTMYFCLSHNNEPMWSNWCRQWHLPWSRNRTLSNTSSINRTWQQRYGQYRLQYIDHNSDANNDFWDANDDGNFIWDDDDLFLGRWPNVFNAWADAWELYLINASWNERTFFRWRIIPDPDRPQGTNCPWSNAKIISWDGCLWTIQILKLVWRDTNGDWLINSWVYHPDFVWGSSDIQATVANSGNYWQNIFSNRIHVSRAEFYLYPNQDINYAWADPDPSLQVSPYLQLSIRLEPSWRERRKIRWVIPSVDIATTINLSSVDMF